MRAPSPSFPRPGETYDPRNEAEFRLSVERAIHQAIQFVVQPRVASVTLPSGSSNDYEIGDWTTILRVTPDAAASSLTGLAGGITARNVLIVNVGSTNLTLAHQSASSAAGNRFLAETGADVVLGANDAADVLYDATTERWRILPQT